MLSLRWLFLISIELNLSSISAYAPLSTTDDTSETRTDKAFVRLAYSNPIYDNVGILRFYTFPKHPGINEYKKIVNASAIFIGKKICLTAAHCNLVDFLGHKTRFEVGFEIGNKEPKYYKVEHFITHPEYEKNKNYDLAILVLEKDVEELQGLKPNYEFSKQQWNLIDYQYPLTYIGYGIKIFDNNWFHIEDYKRRAIQAYTHHCSLSPERLGIYSTPRSQYNQSTQYRPPEPYEGYARNGMSGGAAINKENNVVGITVGITRSQQPPRISTYLFWIAALLVDTIITVFNSCFYSIPSLNTRIMAPDLCTKSVPLGPFEEWIKQVRREYDDIYDIV